MDNYTNFDPLARGRPKKNPDGNFSFFNDRLDSSDSFQPAARPMLQRKPTRMVYQRPFDKSEVATVRAAKTYLNLGRKTSSFIKKSQRVTSKDELSKARHIENYQKRRKENEEKYSAKGENIYD